jgi:predicted lipid-binding transport protein (Tim44 family)
MMAPARWLRSLATLAALALGLLLPVEDADARFEDGLSVAGAGVVLSLPPTISAAPENVAALEGSLVTYSGQPAYQGGSLGGLFNRPGLIGGFAAGFLGAGLLGFLFGHGMVGEITGVASVLGLLFQLALIVMLTRLIWTWWRADQAAAFASLSPRQLADAYGRPRHEVLPDFDASASPEAMLGETKNDVFNR